MSEIITRAVAAINPGMSREQAIAAVLREMVDPPPGLVQVGRQAMYDAADSEDRRKGENPTTTIWNAMIQHLLSHAYPVVTHDR